MSKARSKKEILPVISASQVNEVMAEFAEADAKLQKITSSLDVQITKLREKHSNEIAVLTAKKEEAFEKLQKYTEAEKETLFPGIGENKAKKKSFETAHGTIGFRTATPSIDKLKGYTWESVTQLLKTFLKEYVRTKEEADKEKLLADRNNILVPVDEKDPMNQIPEEQRPRLSSLFPQCGITVKQLDSFYVELKKEEATV